MSVSKARVRDLISNLGVGPPPRLIRQFCLIKFLVRSPPSFDLVSYPNLDLVATWTMVHGPWSMDNGPQTMVQGAWSMSMEHGPWTMAWSMDHDP